MDEPPQIITGTLNVNLTDAQLVDLAVGLVQIDDTDDDAADDIDEEDED
jgi:hypothetical protein